MTAKKKLGKGLDALLSRTKTDKMASLMGDPEGMHPAPAEATSPAGQEKSPGEASPPRSRDGDLRNIPVDLIQPTPCYGNEGPAARSPTPSYGRTGAPPSAVRRSGGQLVASGRIPVQALIAALDAAEAA